MSIRIRPDCSRVGGPAERARDIVLFTEQRAPPGCRAAARGAMPYSRQLAAPILGHPIGRPCRGQHGAARAHAASRRGPAPVRPPTQSCSSPGSRNRSGVIVPPPPRRPPPRWTSRRTPRSAMVSTGISGSTTVPQRLATPARADRTQLLRRQSPGSTRISALQMLHDSVNMVPEMLAVPPVDLPPRCIQVPPGSVSVACRSARRPMRRVPAIGRSVARIDGTTPVGDECLLDAINARTSRRCRATAHPAPPATGDGFPPCRRPDGSATPPLWRRW